MFSFSTRVLHIPVDNFGLGNRHHQEKQVQQKRILRIQFCRNISGKFLNCSFILLCNFGVLIKALPKNSASQRSAAVVRRRTKPTIFQYRQKQLRPTTISRKQKFRRTSRSPTPSYPLPLTGIAVKHDPSAMNWVGQNSSVHFKVDAVCGIAIPIVHLCWLWCWRRDEMNHSP